MTLLTKIKDFVVALVADKPRLIAFGLGFAVAIVFVAVTNG